MKTDLLVRLLTSHFRGFTLSVWVIMCWRNLSSTSNDFQHLRHLKGRLRIPLARLNVFRCWRRCMQWEATCAASNNICLKHDGHDGHAKLWLQSTNQEQSQLHAPYLIIYINNVLSNLNTPYLMNQTSHVLWYGLNWLFLIRQYKYNFIHSSCTFFTN